MCSIYKYPGRFANSAVVGLACLLAGFWPVRIQAQIHQARKPFAELAPDPLQSLHLSNYLIGIVIVFAVLAVASWLLRRYQPRIGGGQIRVHACLSLGGKERLMLIEVQERRLLIGVSPAGISLLQDLDARTQEAPQELNKVIPPETAAGSWLQQTLRSVARR